MNRVFNAGDIYRKNISDLKKKKEKEKKVSIIIEHTGLVNNISGDIFSIVSPCSGDIIDMSMKIPYSKAISDRFEFAFIVMNDNFSRIVKFTNASLPSIRGKSMSVEKGELVTIKLNNYPDLTDVVFDNPFHISFKIHTNQKEYKNARISSQPV